MNQRPYITCRQLIDFIADYLAGELDEMERNDFERHLAVCPSCQAYLDSYRKTLGFAHSVAGDLPVEDIPEELIHTILRRTRSTTS